eukprot:CAMPEP_0197188056 /NCGR_PEP_ID=MMETSP1423-20130617/17135_1 /TAXON_ID=476441 /ORGANISM="Pseudo-nitzschia heimii, Strain UNC1101" /LENGTH=70 /DNA_ID=CAMNT_0042639805 /DNA_START=117 /DNA_END=329 /DNA_ORIENTATION=+
MKAARIDILWDKCLALETAVFKEAFKNEALSFSPPLNVDLKKYFFHRPLACKPPPDRSSDSSETRKAGLV